jgi:hypothetical protein
MAEQQLSREDIVIGPSQNGVEGDLVDTRDERAILLSIERNTSAQASELGRIANAIERLSARFSGGALGLLGKRG